MNLRINSESGEVTTGGIVAVIPSLTPEHILAPPANARPYHCSALPYKMYMATYGNVQVEYCFFENLIVCADFHKIDFISSSEKKAKDRHDHFLSNHFWNAQPPPEVTVTSSDVHYHFSWGTASSMLIYGNAFIRVEYANRRALAVGMRLTQGKHNQQLSRATSFRERLSKKE